MTVVSNPNEYSVEGLVDTGSGNQRVIMTQSVEGTQQDYSETSVECIVEDSSGNKQRCVCVNNFGGGGGSGGVTSVNGKTGAVTLDADDVLPNQTGNSGKFITTNGTNVSWGTINALQNTATGTNAITILGTASTYTNSVNIGANSSVSANNCVCIGYNTSAFNSDGIVVGANSKASGIESLCLGYYSESRGTNSVSIGYLANAKQNNSIQIGRGNNETANTLSIGFNGTSYILLDGSDGTIPAARHATLPASDGTYTLKLTISGGVPTLSWVAD